MSRVAETSMFDIFISYRRTDSRADSGRLYDRLSAHFGDAHVFMDIDDIEPGANFVDSLAASLDNCSVMLVVIGPQWLGRNATGGASRLGAEDDFVRIEILRAMERNMRVIPLLVGGATMPTASALPPAMAQLARFQAYEISDSRFHQDIDQLIETLESEGGERNVRRQGSGSKTLRLGLSAAAIVGLAAALVFWQSTNKTRTAVAVQLEIGDGHAAAGKHKLAVDAYRKALEVDADNIPAYRRLIAATRERFLREGIASTRNISIAIGRHNLHIAPVDLAARERAANDILTARALDPGLQTDVDLLLDEAKILKAGIVDVKRALPVLERAHDLAPSRADVLAELGMLEAVVNDSAAGIDKVREAIALTAEDARLHFYLAESLAGHYRCAYRGADVAVAGEAGSCAEAIRTYRRAHKLAAGDAFWLRHIRHHAVNGALNIFHRYAMKERDPLTANLDMPLKERIAQIEFFLPLESSVSRGGSHDYPEIWLALLYEATDQPRQARRALDALFEKRDTRPEDWLALYARIEKQIQ